MIGFISNGFFVDNYILESSRCKLTSGVLQLTRESFIVDVLRSSDVLSPN